MLTTRQSAFLLGGAAAAAVTLAGCGGGSSSAGAASDGGTQQPLPADHGTVVTATETEFKISLSPMSFKAGKYTFVAENKGDDTHALTVDGNGLNDVSTGDIAPGASKSLTVTLKAGKYDVYCPVADHKMEGMDVPITVA